MFDFIKSVLSKNKKAASPGAFLLTANEQANEDLKTTSTWLLTAFF